MKRRVDKNGRVLKKGETQRKDGLYMFRWVDSRGRQKYIYASSLEELRKKEGSVQQEMILGITRDNVTLNEQIEWYLSTRKNLKKSTASNYMYYYNHVIKDSFLGKMRLCDIRKSHILRFYADLKDEGMANGTIAIIQKILHPAFELAVDDDVIRKNPTKGCMKDYAESQEKKTALNVEQEQEFLERVKVRSSMNWLYPFYAILLITGMRLSEALGLTWEDINMNERTININHQLLYRKINNKMLLYCQDSAKTESGNRIIPMNDEVYRLFIQQKEWWFRFCRGATAEIDGYTNFVFISKMNRNGLPIYPTSVRRNINLLVQMNEERDIQLPPMSPHILRHTAATRMAESGMELKTIQYLLGHSDTRTTLQVYNHVDLERARREHKKYDTLRECLVTQNA